MREIKKLIAILLSIILVFTLIPETAGVAYAAGESPDDWYEVTDYKELKELLKEPGTRYIRLTKTVEDSSPAPRSSDEPEFYVNGTKYLDLNRCSVIFNLDFAYTVGINKKFEIYGKKEIVARDPYMFQINEGADFHLLDSQLMYGEGEIHHEGYIKRRWNDDYEVPYRHIFLVKGKMTVDGGRIIAGRSKQHWAVHADTNIKGLAKYNGHYRAQVNGHAIQVENGGELTVNGGRIEGRGFTLMPDYFDSDLDYCRDAAIIGKRGSKITINDGVICGMGCANVFEIDDGCDIKVLSGSFDTHKIDDIQLVNGESDFGTIDQHHTGSHGHIHLPKRAIDWDNAIVNINYRNIDNYDQYDPETSKRVIIVSGGSGDKLDIIDNSGRKNEGSTSLSTMNGFYLKPAYFEAGRNYRPRGILGDSWDDVGKDYQPYTCQKYDAVWEIIDNEGNVLTEPYEINDLDSESAFPVDFAPKGDPYGGFEFREGETYTIRVKLHEYWTSCRYQVFTCVGFYDLTVTDAITEINLSMPEMLEGADEGPEISATDDAPYYVSNSRRWETRGGGAINSTYPVVGDKEYTTIKRVNAKIGEKFSPNVRLNTDKIQNASSAYISKIISDTAVEVTVSASARHTHQMVWQSDDNAHWKGCRCGMKEDGEKISSHSFDGGVLNTETGMVDFTCSVCGHVTHVSPSDVSAEIIHIAATNVIENGGKVPEIILEYVEELPKNAVTVESYQWREKNGNTMSPGNEFLYAGDYTLNLNLKTADGYFFSDDPLFVSTFNWSYGEYMNRKAVTVSPDHKECSCTLDVKVKDGIMVDVTLPEIEPGMLYKAYPREPAPIVKTGAGTPFEADPDLVNIRWFKGGIYDDGYEPNDDYKFEPEQTYYLMIDVSVPPPYSSDYKVTGYNIVNPHVAKETGTYMEEFDQSDLACPGQLPVEHCGAKYVTGKDERFIKEVAISMPNPEVGTAPFATAEKGGEQDKYDIVDVHWRPERDVFGAEIYTAEVKVKAKEGFWFSTDCVFTFNGVLRWDNFYHLIYNGNGVYTLVYKFPEAHEHKFGECKYVNSVYHGRVCSICGETHLERHEFSEWRNNEDKTGLVRECNICGYTQTSGYEKSDMIIDKHSTVLDFGSFHIKDEITGQTLSIDTIPKLNEIAEVDVDVPVPARGETPTDAYTVAQSMGDSSDYTISEISWDPAASVFDEGTVYTATVTVNADEGYGFRHEGAPVPVFKINGNRAKLVMLSPIEASFSYTFEKTDEDLLPEGCHRVHFDTKGGSYIAPQTVANGAAATRPEDPQKVNRRFEGWYRDKECKEAYDFATPVYLDMRLYAKWERIEISNGNIGRATNSNAGKATNSNADNGGRSGGSGGGTGRQTSLYNVDRGIWKQNEKGWWYQYTDGTWPKSIWKKLAWNGNIDWYFFDENGYMKKDWLWNQGRWYYLGDGAMRTGWYQSPDGFWYYLNPADGGMLTGWLLEGGSWYYLEPVGNASHPLGAMYANERTPDGYDVDENGRAVTHLK